MPWVKYCGCTIKPKEKRQHAYFARWPFEMYTTQVSCLPCRHSTGSCPLGQNGTASSRISTPEWRIRLGPKRKLSEDGSAAEAPPSLDLVHTSHGHTSPTPQRHPSIHPAPLLDVAFQRHSFPAPGAPNSPLWPHPHTCRSSRSCTISLIQDTLGASAPPEPHREEAGIPAHSRTQAGKELRAAGKTSLPAGEEQLQLSLSFSHCAF